jgi:hypothetical protein
VRAPFPKPGHDTVDVFSSTANGRAKPAQSILGKRTKLTSDEPAAIAVDNDQKIYATNNGGNSNDSVLVFAAGAIGDMQPIQRISGAKTGLSAPQGIAVDSEGNIYVSSLGCEGCSGPAVLVFAAGANGNKKPIRIISGANTQLAYPTNISLDASGNLYVANAVYFPSTGLGNSITVYAAGARGNVAPIQSISGYNTLLESPEGVALDAERNIYVANNCDDSACGSVTIYAAGSTGNVAPTGGISGSKTLLGNSLEGGPIGIALDAEDNIYVGDAYDGVVVFAAGANGNVAPARVIDTLKDNAGGLNVAIH